MTAKVLCMVLFIWSAYGRDKIPPCAHGVTKNELGKCGGIGFMSKRTCRTKGRKAYGYQCRILKNGGCPDYHSKGGMGYSEVKINVLRGFTSPNGITFDVCNYVKACTCEQVERKNVPGPPAVSGGPAAPSAPALIDYYDHYEDYDGDADYLDVDEYDELYNEVSNVNADLYWDLTALRALRNANQQVNVHKRQVP
eukprot:435326_1